MDSRIPEISNQALERFSTRIKPLLPFGKKGEWYWELESGDPVILWIVEPSDLRDVGYNSTASQKVKKAPEVEEIARIVTYHTTESQFNASVAEVLSQIPMKLIWSVEYFQVIHDLPIQRARTFYWKEGKEKKYETLFEATTVLYRKKDSTKE